MITIKHLNNIIVSKYNKLIKYYFDAITDYDKIKMTNLIKRN